MPKTKRKIKKSGRTFYRTLIHVEILSEEPVDFDNLESVAHAITEGDCSGKVTDVVNNQPVDGPKMAKLLRDQASDPGFFRLTDEGEDMDEDDDEQPEVTDMTKAYLNHAMTIHGGDAKLPYLRERLRRMSDNDIATVTGLTSDQLRPDQNMDTVVKYRREKMLEDMDALIKANPVVNLTNLMPVL